MGDRQRVLVVDDEESIRFTFESFLSDRGYTVHTAGSYDEAIALLDDGDYDLIFADVILGGKTGIDIMRQVRERGMTCPVVIVTGAPNIETASEAVRLGAFDYLPKPVYQDALLRVASLALKHKALIDEKERYRANIEAIFRSVKDSIITVDREQRIVALNPAAQIFCVRSRDCIGKPLDIVTFACGRHCLSSLAETVRTGKPVEVSGIECRQEGGPVRVVSLSSSPLIDHAGGFAGAVVVIRDETRLSDLERDLMERRRFHNIVGSSRAMQEIYNLMESLADVQTTVLITGESGTGKELVAEALHFMGGRSSRPLVKVNCSALSEGLLESELFGHVRGAFTGALRDKIGRFQRADGGTIFLDEIGDITPHTQVRLLRVLQEMEFERVGDSSPIRVDVRVITATNRDLTEKVRRGEFREDLYYRLKVMEITLPPLRERTEDIPLLTEHFLVKLNKKLNREVRAVSSDVQKLFMEYPWPGNVRELEHVLEHAFILCRQETITVEHLPPALRGYAAAADAPEGTANPDEVRMAILRALDKAGGNKAKAARLLKIDRKTLYRKLDKLGLLESE